MKGFFVSGTDTEIGKTVASAILLAHLSKKFKVHYHKPVQTGLESDNDAQTVKELTKDFSNLTTSLGEGFLRPLSPHLAALYENRRIDLKEVVRKTEEAAIGEINIIEGAGGLLVPLNSRYLIIDLIEALELPCILVARSKIGTINHTLLSLEALRARRITVAGIILMGERKPDTEKSLKFYGRIENILSISRGQISPLFINQIIDRQASELDNFLR